MKFTINTIDFRNAMEKAYKGVDKKSVLPILQNVKLHIEQDSNYLLGSNLENFVIAKIDVYGCNETLDIIFSDTATLLKAMKFFTGTDIIFKVEQNRVTISCGNKQAVQDVFDQDEKYPDVPSFEVAASNQYQYSINLLRDRFNLIKYAVSKTDVKPIFTGIHFNDTDMVALDGYRLALSKSDDLYVEKPFTLPAESISLMVDVLKNNIKIETNNKYVKVSDCDTTIISRLFAEAYMDYKSVIPRDGKDISVNVAEYENTLKYFKVFKQTGKNAAKQNVVWFNGKLELLGTGTKGKIEIINGTFDSPIGFDNSYMLEAIAQFKTDSVIMSIKNAMSPIVIKSGDSYLALVLPVRLKPEDAEAIQAA